MSVLLVRLSDGQAAAIVHKVSLWQTSQRGTTGGGKWITLSMFKELTTG